MGKSKPDRGPQQPKGPELAAYQVVLMPVITEKGTHHAERHNSYTFQVHPQATKKQIRSAVEELFDVTVVSIRTQARGGKARRYRQNLGRTAKTKKAIVKLSDQDRISLF